MDKVECKKTITYHWQCPGCGHGNQVDREEVEVACEFCSDVFETEFED